MQWINTFFREFGQSPSNFLSPCQPIHLPNAQWVSWSNSSAQALGLSEHDLDWLALLSGAQLPQGVQPCATVYSGHQFGVWAGQLGDGRALLLGELQTDTGIYELNLKGAGKTPYSRGGDGLAVLRSTIREYLCSEAMAGLGVPTTRALCMVSSTKQVIREQLETAATVLRVAPSFIRFGHFEHFAAKGDVAALQKLADFVCQSYYPQTLQFEAGDPARYVSLFQAVSQKTAELIAHWQSVGFCHGVMNTDNMSILGLTLDYGPFGFLDQFDLWHRCNHSDEQGRYAYSNQAKVAHWNLACLAQALSLLMDDHEPLLKDLQAFMPRYTQLHQNRFMDKLGLPQNYELADEFLKQTLQCMHVTKPDMTLFFRHLSHAVYTQRYETVRDLCLDTAVFDQWLEHYEAIITKLALDRQACSHKMLATNPKYILRNHLAELAIEQATQGHYADIEQLLRVLQAPFEEHSQDEHLAGLPPDWARTLAVSCSS